MKSKKILAGILALTLMCAPAAADFSFANNFNISASAEDISDDATEMFWLGKESGITNGKIGVPNGYYDNNGNNISEKDEYGNNINSDLYDSNKTFKYRVHIDKLSDFGFVYTGMAQLILSISRLIRRFLQWINTATLQPKSRALHLLQ